MPRYVAEISIPINSSHGTCIHFEVEGNSPENAFENAQKEVASGRFDSDINGRPFELEDIQEHHRLADTLDEIEKDDDVGYLGYKCLGKMTDLYPDLPEHHADMWYRTWIWANDKGERIATWDVGNSFCSYMCEGTEESLLSYFTSQETVLEEYHPEPTLSAEDDELPF